jgi:mannose-1-phosphate guanylyltransferase
MRSISQAFVLGAGLGTRLRPLTDDIPKPLVPIFQKPLITFALDHLIAAGLESFVVNTHRQPEAFDHLFPDQTYAGRRLILVNEPALLETGGGIKNVESKFRDDAFITYSGDILTDIDLRSLIEEHVSRDNDVTLALRKTGLASAISFRDGRVVDIANRYGIPGSHDFANIAVWKPTIFRRIPEIKKISFIPVLADWIGDGGRIGGIVLNDGKWFNIGSRNEYLEVHRSIANGWRPGYVKSADWAATVAPSATVDPTATLRGCSVAGPNCRVAAEVVLHDTILWPGAQIASRSKLIRCIVRSAKKVTGNHRDIDI